MCEIIKVRDKNAKNIIKKIKMKIESLNFFMFI